MKAPVESQQPIQPIQPDRTRLRKKRGVALILVVSFIVLLSALVVGFFSRVSTDLAGARSYAEGVSVRQLADSAVGVVTGQIRAATTLANGCWASQPGMIRVYRTGGGQPGPQAYAFYKLYSSHNLIVSGSDIQQFDPALTTASSGARAEVPMGTGGWLKQPAFFSDINEPVDVPNPDKTSSVKTIKRYPIFDPSVARIPSLNQNTASNITNWVEGLEVNLPQGPDLTKNNALMPVRWQYVLKDGTLTAPTPLSGPASGTVGLKAVWDATGIGGTATGVPSKDNPIVGRIAYWTDDDTSKVNINTAGGHLLPDGVDEDKNLDNAQPTGKVPETNPAYIAGSFWDTPRVQTYFDRGKSGPPDVFRGGLANSQPVRNEFQRYPGHPSTTDLGLVFKHLLPTGKTGFDSEKLYTMTPRLMPGASEGGTKQLVAYELQVNPDDYGIDADPPSLIKRTFDPLVPYRQNDPKTWSYHLLGSVDELLYTTLNGNRQLTEDVIKINKNSLTPRLVDQTRFVLTAHSRSPELNLFGRPRVSIWPVPTPKSEGNLLSTLDPDTHKPGIRNPTDDLLRFCSTVGGDGSDNAAARKGQFIFDREDPYNSSSKPGSGDFNRLRNQKIFNYLRSVTSSTQGLIPGWGASFEGKYAQGPGGRDQILVEIFDYIRSVNLKDTSRDQRIDRAKGRTSTAQKVNPAAQALKAESRYAKRGIVVPTRTTVGGKPVSGFGRFPTASEISLVFYHGGYVYTPKPPARPTEAVEYDFRRLFTGDKSTPVSDAFLKRVDMKNQLIRAFLIIETYNPMQGYGPVTNLDSGTASQERIVYDITKLSGFQIQTKSMHGPQGLGLGTGKNNVSLSSGATWGGRNFGGTEGFAHTIHGKTSADPAKLPYPGQTYYPFQTPCKNDTDGIRVGMEDTEFDFTGGSMDIEIRYVDKAHDDLPAHNELIQTLKLTWPAGKGWPLPITEREAKIVGEGYRQDLGGFDPRVSGWDTDTAGAKYKWSSYGGARMAYNLPQRIGWSQLPSWSPWTRLDPKGNVVGDDKHYGGRFLQILQPGDTIRSLVPGGTDAAATDPRVAHLQQIVTTFKAHPNYNKADPNPNLMRRAETLRFGSGGFYFDPRNATWFPGQTDEPVSGSLAALPGKTRYIAGNAPDLPKGIVAKRADGQAADFDTGIGNFPDGAFCGKADEGNLARSWKDEWGVWHYVEPYFSTWTYDAPGDTYFSPNRQIPSPVMFGSLLAPQTTWDRSGWKTLLFCPNPAGDNHPGTLSPPDHLWLDLFNMPVVEPYAISEPFSTDGKVNLNYPMMPFGYIKRTTALRAALHPLRVTAIPNNFTRKSGGATELRYKGVDNKENLRYLVDRDETLKAFDAFFDEYKINPSRGFFKSATQICERYLYPKGNVFGGSKIQYQVGEGAIKKWWQNNSVTGDNVREKPYSDLYSRITTKSNTYTVHYRVQTLRQRPYTGKDKNKEAEHYRTWDEGKDQVLSEYRGHTTIERYLDPEDPRFEPTYTKPDKIDVEAHSLEDAYRFRVIYNKRFSPW